MVASVDAVGEMVTLVVRRSSLPSPRIIFAHDETSQVTEEDLVMEEDVVHTVLVTEEATKEEETGRAIKEGETGKVTKEGETGDPTTTTTVEAATKVADVDVGVMITGVEIEEESLGVMIGVEEEEDTDDPTTE